MNKITSAIIEKTKTVLNDANIISNYRKNEKCFTRKRVLDFVTIILMCLNLMKKSLQAEIDDFFEYAKNIPDLTATKQAFSKARQNIKFEIFKDLFEMSSKVAIENKQLKTLNGFHFLAIDGTEFLMPKSKETDENFAKAHGSEVRKARVSTLCDVLSGYIIHAEISSTSICERKLAKRHLDYLKELKIENSVVIFDRGYPSKEMFKYLCDNDIKFIIRTPKSFNKEIDKSKKKDFNIELSGCNIRVLKFKLSSGEIETLSTNLTKNDFKLKEFKELYHLRWQIEVIYDTLKNKFKIETFSGKTMTVILQDFYANLFMSNLINSIKLESDFMIEKHTNENKNKLKFDVYKTNINLLISTLKHRLIKTFFYSNSKAVLSNYLKLLNRVHKRKCPVIPDRHFARNTYYSKVTQKEKSAL